MSGVGDVLENDLYRIIVSIPSGGMEGGPLGHQVMDQQGGTIVQQQLNYLSGGEGGRKRTGGAGEGKGRREKANTSTCKAQTTYIIIIYFTTYL